MALAIQPTATTTALAPASSTTAQGAAPNAYTANICGASACGQQGNVAQVNHLQTRIGTLGGTPLHVGMQEACGNQVTALGLWLDWVVDPNHQTAMYPQLTGPLASLKCGGFSSVFGVASYVLAAPGTPFVIRPFVEQDPMDEEVRGSACILGAAGYFYTGCTAHVTNGDQDWQNAQFAEYVSVDIVPRSAGANAHAVLWGGDMNLLPGELIVAIPGFSYANHLEADRCAGDFNRWTFNAATNKKIDYVFRSGPNRACAGDATLWPATDANMFNNPGATIHTDHRIESGRWA